MVFSRDRVDIVWEAMPQSFHPKMFGDADETWFVCDSHAVNTRLELISQSFNPKTSRDHHEKRIRFTNP